MKYIFRIFLFLMLFSSVGANEYRYTKTIKLKKDECKKILVKYEKQEKLFKFRWTLYVNGGLVILRSYDRIVAQNILYKRYKNQSFIVYLKPKGTGFNMLPYMLIKFVEFDYETGEATFMLNLSDENLQVSLEDLEDNKEG